MAKKITLETVAAGLSALGKEVRQGFAKQGGQIQDLTESLSFVVKHMATKEDLAELKAELKGDIAGVQTQVNSVERQLRETRTEIRLGDLEEKVFGQARR